MARPYAYILLPLLAACAQMPERDTGGTQPAQPMACNAEAANGAIGKAPTDAVVQQAQRDAGAARVRVIRPGDAVTMDYRGDRLNIDVSAQDSIASLRCG